jgi:indolepyruvate ferredoxin oxidoreductase
MGDTIYVNPMILGYAWQKGWVPLHRESLVRAIELNDVQVKNNLAAFEWGRHAAQHLPALMQQIRNRHRSSRSKSVTAWKTSWPTAWLV